MHKADEVAPGKAVLHGGDGPLPDRGPDAAQQGFEANTMFVGRPQLDLGVGGRPLAHGLQQRPYFFLKLSCCSGSANAWARSRHLRAVLEALQIVPAALHPAPDAPAGRPSSRLPPDSSNAWTHRAPGRPTPPAAPPAERPRACAARATR